MQPKHFEHLRDLYPDTISKEQMYKICHISKKTAKELLDTGTIPCINSGKKTHKYTIRLQDVIRYLERRESYGNPLPPKSKKKHICPHVHIPEQILESKDTVEAMKRYFEREFTQYPGVLTSKQLEGMLGIRRSRILKLLKDGVIQSWVAGVHYRIPKPYAIDFAVTHRYRYARHRSERYLRLINGLIIYLQQPKEEST